MPKYFEFDVALQGISPRIWRRMLIRSTTSFADLHGAIQDAFGWQNCHLWEFRMPAFRADPIAGSRMADAPDHPTPNGRTTKLASYFTGHVRVEWCEYAYDFGDGWIHDVKLVALRTEKESFKRRLLGGDRAGPPEDCGGPRGYERMAQFVATGVDADGEDPEHLARWLGAWRPEAFDLVRTKERFDR